VSMRTQSLANILLRDALAERPEVHVDLNRCLLCSRTFTAGKGVGANGRFCSRLCIEAFDAGYAHRSDGSGPKDWAVVVPAYDGGGAVKNPVGSRPYARAMTPRGDGFLVECRHCKKQFVSRGLRCCSPECERQVKEDKKTVALLAEVQMESTGYVPRKCEHCDGAIPRYTGVGKARKETRKDARFCSKSCAEKARRLPKTAGPLHPPIDHQEVPVPQQVPVGASVPLDLVGSGAFKFRDAGLDRETRRAILDAEVPASTTVESGSLAPDAVTSESPGEVA
jgi:hypothetical protein